MKILHLLEYKLIDIMDMLGKIKSQGFDTIQISPMQELKEDGKQLWWMYYQPRSFNIGNYSGTKEDLKRLCSLARDLDINIVVDVVLNHLGGKNDGTPLPHESISENLRMHKEYWKSTKEIEDYTNRTDVITNCLKGLPSLNHNNKEIQEMITAYLKDLISCGVKGFRFDAAKHIALPKEGGDFWPELINSIKDEVNILYGEIIFEKDINLLSEYIKYFYILSNEHDIDIKNIITFVESHDDYLMFESTTNISSDEINKKYLELSKNFEHILYYARPENDGWKQGIIKQANNS